MFLKIAYLKDNYLSGIILADFSIDIFQFKAWIFLFLLLGKESFAASRAVSIQEGGLSSLKGAKPNRETLLIASATAHILWRSFRHKA